MALDQAKQVNRRGFLKGSALFAATVAGLAVAVPASAQDTSKPAPAPPAKTDEAPKKEEPAGDQKAKLLDKSGREYRVCDMCGGNMYLSEKMWTCEQCGFSYEV